MYRLLPLLLLALAALLSPACILDQSDDLEPGYVRCGEEHKGIVCQPGMYCSSPNLAICHEGCVSDANCMLHERCLKEEEGDRVGDCIDAERRDRTTY